MTDVSSIDVEDLASEDPMPLIPLSSTLSKLDHFDSTVFKIDETTHLYKLVDALCGDVGAGSLKKELLNARLLKQIDTIQFGALDRLFSGSFNLPRLSSESYQYNPEVDMLDSEQWDEVYVKDAWYRARAKDFFTACSLGGTPDGIRMAVHAAIGTDCDLYEVWRYRDTFGIKKQLGRLSQSLRNEVVVAPHKADITPREKRLILEATDKIKPADSVITVDPDGLSVHTPVKVRGVGADSSYFEVQKTVTVSPELAKIPPPEYLAADIIDSEKWIFKATTPTKAPTAAYNSTQEYSLYYTYSDRNTSPISIVEYKKSVNGTQSAERNYSIYSSTGQSWVPFGQADSPDNFPGGKYGLHPSFAPALNYDSTPYKFPYTSQAAYQAKVTQQVIAQGGTISSDGNSYTMDKPSTSVSKTFLPHMIFNDSIPSRDSKVTSSSTQSLGILGHTPIATQKRT